MITCVFGLTACGSEDTLTAMEQSKLSTAEKYAAQEIVPDLQMFMDDDNAASIDGYTAEEIEYLVAENFDINVEGYAFISAVSSFNSAKDTMGQIVSIGEAEGEIDDDQIVVYVQIEGEKKNAEAEIVLSNDMFLTLESASLNPVSTMGELMGKAALNTLIGMGTVFIVLILISCIISLFKYIPKIQESFSKKNKPEPKTTGVDKAVAQIVVQEETSDETDDLELVAVIAAAIAASEGASSTDGFVVRSIRKVNRARR
jgi:sodium pump decarboxylase gamma subunit